MHLQWLQCIESCLSGGTEGGQALLVVLPQVFLEVVVSLVLSGREADRAEQLLWEREVEIN